MIVAELLRELAKLPADMPVVVSQEDEPLSGVYGVTAVSVERMKRDTYWHHRETWDFSGHYGAEPDPRIEVCYLDVDEPAPVVVDAEQPSAAVARPAVEAPGRLIPGDDGYQGPWPTAIGPTWRQIVAASLPAMTPRELAVTTEAQRQADLVDDEHQGDPLDPRGRCAICGKPAIDELCAPCTAAFKRRPD
jgi:hypothetical protein